MILIKKYYPYILIAGILSLFNGSFFVINSSLELYIGEHPGLKII